MGPEAGIGKRESGNVERETCIRRIVLDIPQQRLADGKQNRKQNRNRKQNENRKQNRKDAERQD